MFGKKKSVEQKPKQLQPILIIPAPLHKQVNLALGAGHDVVIVFHFSQSTGSQGTIGCELPAPLTHAQGNDLLSGIVEFIRTWDRNKS